MADNNRNNYKSNGSNNNSGSNNKKNSSTVNNRKYRRKQGDMLHNWLIFAAAGLVPMLVQLIASSSGLAAYDWFSSKDMEYDFFLKCKMIGIIVIACAMLVIIATRLYSKSSIYMPYFKDNRLICICAAVYIAAAFLSSVLADDVHGAFAGMYAQHEPFPVLAGYMVFLIFVYIFITSDDAVISFLKLFMWGVAVISFLGVLQFLACDFFTTYAGKSLITMFSDISAESISLSFDPGRVYMTLYNPNYVGSYVALVLPIMIAGVYVMDHMWQKAVMGINAVMLIVCLIGSASTTGMTAVAVCFILTCALCIPLMKRFGKYIGIMLGAAVVCMVAVVSVNHDKINEALDKYRLTEDTRILTSMQVHDDGVELGYKDTTIYVSCNISDGGQMLLDVSDADHNKLTFAYDQASDTIVSGDEFYKDIYFSGARISDGSIGFNVICGGTYTFVKDDDGSYYYYNVYGKKTKDIVNSKSIGFKGHESFASNRGFIWSRSIPLLFKNIIYGCGPDNFVYEYPNNDYVAMHNNTYSTQVVTRPHNMYLQTGVQTGVLSLIAILVLYGAYFVQSVRLLYGKKDIGTAYIMSLAILVGSFGYMVCGVANDSTVCVAPVFWILLGLGMECNHILKGKCAQGK